MLIDKSKTVFIILFVVGFLLESHAKKLKNCAISVIDASKTHQHLDIDLPLYFPDHIDDNKSVYLYRGIDEATFDPNFIGEASLIWTSLNIHDALGYAVARVSPKTFHNGHRQVLILMYEVPKHLVYQMNSWPVLRTQDWPTPLEAIVKVAVIKLNSPLVSWLHMHPGEDKLLYDKIVKRNPDFADGKGTYWVQGKKMEAYILQVDD